MANHFIYFSPLGSIIKFWGPSEMNHLNLEGTMRVEFGNEKHCIGYNDGTTLHPCPGKMSGQKQCPACAARDILRLYTRLDFRGFGQFYGKFRNQQFSVYLASFGHMVKCGVTCSSRLAERVREQGVDYFSEIAKTDNAEAAYSIEKKVQRNFAIRSGITSLQKLRLLNQENPARITAYIPKIKESGLLDGCEGEMKVRSLAYDVPPSVSEAPNIEGKILSCKGQLLFFEKGSSHYAVNMSTKSGTIFVYSRIGS